MRGWQAVVESVRIVESGRMAQDLTHSPLRARPAGLEILSIGGDYYEIQ